MVEFDQVSVVPPGSPEENRHGEDGPGSDKIVSAVDHGIIGAEVAVAEEMDGAVVVGVGAIEAPSNSSMRSTSTFRSVVANEIDSNPVHTSDCLSNS